MHDVKVSKTGRCWHRNKTDLNAATEEIVLSDDERRDFAAWCKERAESLRKRADEIETRYAVRAEVER